MTEENIDQVVEVPAPAQQASAVDAVDAVAGQDGTDDPSDGVATPMAMPDIAPKDGSQVHQTFESDHAIEVLGDVELDVKIELGRSHMLVADVLALEPGKVVELDKLAGDPVDVYVNNRLVARGEVLVVNESFCVRVNEIINDGE